MKKIIKAIGIILVVVAIGIGALFTVLFTVGRNKAGNADLAEETKSQESDNAALESETEKQLIENFEVSHTSETIPSKMMEFTEVNVGGKNVKKYHSANDITFGAPSAYSDLEGVITFRGNNFRDNPTFGEAEMKKYQLKPLWNVGTGSMRVGEAYWSGNGWTGQPLLAHWPRETKKHMKMKKWAKEDDNLVEAIYASMDGNIYFLDIKTGRATRKPMKLGFVFKGAGALDPRGYPIMYVGAGYDSTKGTARAFIINLVDCTVMHEYGSVDPFSLRGHLSYFDSSALVDAETDTLIQPGENGILYLIKLNTSYDKSTGKLSINPKNVVKWRYKGKRNNTQNYWVGMEDSAAIYGSYLYIADNGGNLMCLDLNTLKVCWVQDIVDDSNSTPVLSVEEGKLYLYISTSFHLGWRSKTTAKVPIWKIDASNGKVIWKRDYTCSSVDGASGGVQSTIACGKKSLDKYVYVTVSRTKGTGRGVLACIDKATGKIVWEQEGPYSWSSPVCVYNKDGSGGKDMVVYARCDSKLIMVDGLTGETASELSLGGGNVEASPAVYNDTLIIGTRGCKIYGIKLG